MLSLGSDRAHQLSDNGMLLPVGGLRFRSNFIDGLLADIIDRLPSDSKYTLLYVTSPREFPESDSVVYEPSDEFNQEGMHMDLKRDYSSFSSSSSSSESDRRQSLFDEYQYFTPGSYRY
jgi:hypothetical protein